MVGRLIRGFGLLMFAGLSLSSFADGLTLKALANSPSRTPAFVQRDQYRHPVQTLEFFGVKPDMTVVEIWPGKGWYTEILGPFLSKGRLYAAHFAADSGVKYFRDSRASFEAKTAAHTGRYPSLILSEFSPKGSRLAVPDGSADRVLTFRNVHNWLRGRNEQEAFHLFYRVLKPGGKLGVVEHRAPAGVGWQVMKDSGYVSEAYVIELAEAAGFKLEARSEINANQKDSADHPHGVWSLPPTLRGDELERERYIDIGESDRMTLRFIKPRR